jgi:PAS domain S-box-containing protein
MNNLNKTKEELVKKLQELQKEYDALRESSEKDIIERKKTEEKLLIINKALESASDAIGISDAQGHHFYQNKALSDLFEYATTDELETAGGGKAVVKDPKVAKVMFGNIMSGKSWSGELEMVTKSGRVFPAYERADAIKDNEGNIIGLIGIISDITQHKRAEDALRESNAMYQAIFESTGAVTLIIDEDATILMANNECYSVTGYTPAELIGQKWTQYVAPESLQKMLKNQLLRRENPNLAPKKYEVKMVNKKGELRNAIVDIGVIPSTKQGVVSILDITESKRVEEELRLSEEKYRTLFENMGDGVGFINEEEIFVYANQSAEKIFGVDEGGLTGLCINDFLVGVDKTDHLTAFRRFWLTTL